MPFRQFRQKVEDYLAMGNRFNRIVSSGDTMDDTLALDLRAAEVELVMERSLFLPLEESLELAHQQGMLTSETELSSTFQVSPSCATSTSMTPRLPTPGSMHSLALKTWKVFTSGSPR